MPDATQAPAIRRFGAFEVNLQSGELRKNGMRLRLSGQPFQILAVLLERPGEVVTREELHSKLWQTDTFVDFDHGLNNAVARIREVLDDSSGTPRYVETIPRRGYRFIAPLADVRPATVTPSAAEPRAVSRGSPDARNVATVEVTPSRTKQAVAAVALCLITAAALIFILRGRIFRTNQAAQIHSIAVIPLANLSGDPAQEYFADGMTDELTTALAKNHSLRVVSRTSAMQYKGVQRPAREIARELGVDGILEGSVSRNANRVHMTVQLIYTPTDSHLWAESYDRDLNQAYSLPEELSQIVAKEVKTATSPAPAPRYINPEAHDAYLRGRFLWVAWEFPQAMTNFEKAIQLQPDYAAAWSGLSDTYTLEAIDGSRPASEVSAQAKSAARKALELDDSLPDAHGSMCSWYTFFAWDLPRADAECRRAIELNPNGELHYLHHWVLLAMDRQDEAAQEIKRDVELEPFARAWGLGVFYLAERQFDSAINELQSQSRFRPDDWGVHQNLAKAYRLKGMYKESELESEKLLQLQGRADSVVAVRKAWERGGEKAVDRWGVEDLKAQARRRYVSSYALAEAVSYTGDKDETVKYLSEAFGQHDANLINIQNDPLFDFIHSDPRYQTLIRKIGLQLAK